MNRIIDSLAERLAAAFIKAVEPKLQALLDRQFDAAEDRALELVKKAIGPAAPIADTWTGLFKKL